MSLTPLLKQKFNGILATMSSKRVYMLHEGCGLPRRPSEDGRKGACKQTQSHQRHQIQQSPSIPTEENPGQRKLGRTVIQFCFQWKFRFFLKNTLKNDIKSTRVIYIIITVCAVSCPSLRGGMWRTEVNLKCDSPGAIHFIVVFNFFFSFDF